MDYPMIEFKDEPQLLQVLQTTTLMGKELTVYGTPENPLFVAKDIAAWIDYDQSSVNKMVNTVDDDEKVRNIIPTLGGNQEMWTLTEDGLYEVLMQSRKPIAKQFKKGVKKILNEIRTKGSFSSTAVQPKTQAELSLMIAQSLVDQERRVMALESRMDAIDAEREENNRRLLDEERLSVEMPEKELNARIRRLVNNFAESRHIAFDTVWNKVYRELEDRYHQRPKQCKREKSDKSWLDVAVRKGYGDNMLVIASNLETLFS